MLWKSFKHLIKFVIVYSYRASQQLTDLEEERKKLSKQLKEKESRCAGKLTLRSDYMYVNEVQTHSII